MSTQQERHAYLCFGRNAKTGNRACVILNDTSDEATRQAQAKALNAPACVFVEVPHDGTLLLDYYYPHARSPLCLHATLAACRWFFERHPEKPTVHISTHWTHKRLSAQRLDTQILIELEHQAAPAIEPSAVELIEWFGTQASFIGRPALASVGSPKLLLEAPDRPALEALMPNLPAIMNWGRQHGVNGCYVYCRIGEHTYAGRNFNHLDPAMEDAATGVAAGALAIHLQHDLTLEQGDLLGQPCTLQARYYGERVSVGGLCVRS